MTFSDSEALVCCEPETPVIETWVLPELAFEAAEKVNVPLLPAARARVEGEIVTPEGKPVTVTVIDPEKPFCGTACICTF